MKAGRSSATIISNVFRRWLFCSQSSSAFLLVGWLAGSRSSGPYHGMQQVQQAPMIILNQEPRYLRHHGCTGNGADTCTSRANGKQLNPDVEAPQDVYSTPRL